MLQKFQNNPFLTLAVLIIIMLGFNLNVIPVSIMEARNFITAREMITDQNWLLTTMNGEARYQKPPLPSWICALFGLIFGIESNIAMRFPALVFMFITAQYTYLLSKKLTENISQSLQNALILVTSFYVIAIAFEAPSDIFTHGFMMMGIYHIFVLFKDNKAFLKRMVLAGIFIGCSILSKGPVSFYVLLLPFVLAYGCSFKYQFSKKLVFAFLGTLLLALLIGGSWYIYVRLEDPETFKAIAEKETGNWSSYNVRPFYYYWSFFVQSGMWTIPAIVGLLYPYLKSRVRHLKAYQFSLFWTLFAVVLLSIIPEKKSRYLMPVLIPLAINSGFYIEYLIQNFKHIKEKRERFPVYLHFGLMALIAIALPVALFFILDQNLSEVFWSYLVLSISMVVIGILLIIQLQRKHLINTFYLNICFFAALLCFGLPVSEALKSKNYSSISQLHVQLQEAKLQLYGLDYVAPEMLWDFGDKIPQMRTDSVISFPSEDRFGVLTSDLKPEDLKLLESNYHLEKKGSYDLNISEKGSRGYKGRLQNDFYILSRKD
ncbi:glycosyltransferase family 39 protein [Sediminibacter sp. Hel_I_10]|uniref:ArnT family glycosyltransferase n=1 Tax=Sediminibacter sp. Hel_I_10 TaxID=1392490 RepID=UPI00047A8AA9|nr:hypothetical protein [Sediminibacter sp. Hel_I_10]